MPNFVHNSNMDQNDGFNVRVIKSNNKDYPTISLSIINNEKPDITLITYGGIPNCL